MGVILTLKPKPSMRAAVFVTCNLLTMNPGLGILAGISTDDGSQAWRYFPELDG